MSETIAKAQLTALLYEFLEAISLFEAKEEGLFGASWREIFLMKRLSDRGGLQVGEAARELNIPLFAASRAVSRLQARGLVAKRRGRGDGRTVVVAPTAAGRRLLKRVEDYQCELITRNIGVLEGFELSSTIAAIGKLRALLEI